MKRLTKLVATLGVGMSLALPMVSTSTVLADESTTIFETNHSAVNVQGLFDQKTTTKQAGSEWGLAAVVVLLWIITIRKHGQVNHGVLVGCANK